MTLTALVHKTASWLDGSGPQANIVFSSRVRLARNLSQYKFVSCSTAEDLVAVLSEFREAAKIVPQLRQGTLIDISKLNQVDRSFLLERHLLSPALAVAKKSPGLYVAGDEMISAMINEEDHIRLQVIKSGLQLRQTWQIIDGIDDDLSDSVPYAYSDQYGYLTACPTNVGTGLRASVLIHLPALVLTKDIDKVIKGISQVGLTVRGFYGEGTEVLGNLFQVSNQATLGRSEEEIVDNVEQVTNQIIDLESKARQTLLADAGPQIEDKIWRAWGILKNARMLTSQELMSLVSAVRLGVSMGIVQSVPIASLNHLMILMQPAHLQKLSKRKMDASERDMLRAKLVRTRLSADAQLGEISGSGESQGSSS
jgi:protein arginine kinase